MLQPEGVCGSEQPPVPQFPRRELRRTQDIISQFGGGVGIRPCRGDHACAHPHTTFTTLSPTGTSPWVPSPPPPHLHPGAGGAGRCGLEAPDHMGNQRATFFPPPSGCRGGRGEGDAGRKIPGPVAMASHQDALASWPARGGRGCGGPHGAQGGGLPGSAACPSGSAGADGGGGAPGGQRQQMNTFWSR